MVARADPEGTPVRRRDSYWSQPRPDLLELTTRFTKRSRRLRALDVGCANGVLSEALFSVGFSEVWGVEPDAACARQAASRLTGVVAAPFPNDEVAKYAPFDLVVFGDSLEHLEDPWTGLTAARSLLSRDGTLILTVPNVAHYSVLLRAMKGHWEYEESGLLDKTHLRFFTPKSIVISVQRAGLIPVFERRVCMLPQSALKRVSVRAVDLLASHLVASKVDLVCRRNDSSPLPKDSWEIVREFYGNTRSDRLDSHRQSVIPEWRAS